jgi:hypothetical protein
MLPRLRAKLVTGFPPLAYLIGGHPYVPGRLWEFQLVENTDTHLSWVGSDTRVTCRQEQQGGWRVTADSQTMVEEAEFNNALTAAYRAMCERSLETRVESQSEFDSNSVGT